MKSHEKGHHHGHAHFFIHLALEALTLGAAIATLHEIEKVRHAIKRREHK